MLCHLYLKGHCLEGTFGNSTRHTPFLVAPHHPHFFHLSFMWLLTSMSLMTPNDFKQNYSSSSARCRLPLRGLYPGRKFSCRGPSAPTILLLVHWANFSPSELTLPRAVILTPRQAHQVLVPCSCCRLHVLSSQQLLHGAVLWGGGKHSPSNSSVNLLSPLL